jgi:hypothetical protein
MDLGTVLIASALGYIGIDPWKIRLKIDVVSHIRLKKKRIYTLRTQVGTHGSQEHEHQCNDEIAPVLRRKRADLQAHDLDTGQTPRATSKVPRDRGITIGSCSTNQPKSMVMDRQNSRQPAQHRQPDYRVEGVQTQTGDNVEIRSVLNSPGFLYTA